MSINSTETYEYGGYEFEFVSIDDDVIVKNAATGEMIGSFQIVLDCTGKLSEPDFHYQCRQHYQLNI